MTRDELLDELATERQVNRWWKTVWTSPRPVEPAYKQRERPAETWALIIPSEDPGTAAERLKAMAEDFGCKCHSCKTRPRKAA
jgi:hypothetical protein